MATRKRKHKRRLNFVARVAIVLLGVLIIDVCLAIASLFLPYIQSTSIFSSPIFYITGLSIAGLLAIFMLYRVYKNYRASPEHRNVDLADVPPVVQYPKCIILSALVGFAISLITSMSFAVPSKYFARTPVHIITQAKELSGFRTVSPLYWVLINFKYHDDSDWVIWKWHDPSVYGLKPKDCIELDGRQWSAGIYIDSIARSNRCARATQ